MQKNLKSVCLLMALLLTTSIVSCGKTEENETTTTSDTTAKTGETKEEGPTVYAADYLFTSFPEAKNFFHKFAKRG